MPESTKTDAYMFGCFIIEVMTGHEPWWWLTPSQLELRRDCNTTPPRNPLDDGIAIRKLWTVTAPPLKLAHPLLGLVRALLSPDPTQRPDIDAAVSTLALMTAGDSIGKPVGHAAGHKLPQVRPVLKVDSDAFSAS